MGVYGKVFLLNEKAEDNNKYARLEDFIYYEICDQDSKKFKLCKEYCINKIKPIQKIVKQAINNLKMNHYCKDIFYYEEPNYWMKYGILIAEFNRNKMKEDIKSSDGLYKENSKACRELIKEIKKLNDIKYIKIDFSKYDDDEQIQPAVFIDISKSFFKEFLENNPKTISKNRTGQELKNDQKIIIEKINSIVDKFNTNPEYKKIIFDEKIKEYCIKEIKTFKTDLEEAKHMMDPNWLRKNYSEFSNASDEEIKNYIDEIEDEQKEYILKLQNSIKTYTDFSKGKLSGKIKMDSMIVNKEMIFFIDKKCLTSDEIYIIIHNYNSRFFSTILNDLRSDEDVKKMNVKFNYSISENKLLKMIKELDIEFEYFSIVL